MAKPNFGVLEESIRKTIEHVGRDFIKKKSLSPEDVWGLANSTTFTETLVEPVAETFSLALRELVWQHQCAIGEVSPNYSYPRNYHPKKLPKQIASLKRLFPGIGDCDKALRKQIVEGKIALPEGAENWFAIPNLKKRPDILRVGYNKAVGRLMDSSQVGAFLSYGTKEDFGWRLRQSDRSKKFWAKLIADQGNPDILIVPAQFGKRYAGCSAQRARSNFKGNEFGLGIFAVLTMCLTHKERVGAVEGGHAICCSGDDCVGNQVVTAGRDFNSVPMFLGGLEVKWLYGPSNISEVHSDHGHVTGFIFSWKKGINPSSEPVPPASPKLGIAEKAVIDS